ncbi:hypothetical protein ACWGBY_35285 [Streptomyces griseus]|nr:hypothetical protein [Streptomyces sp. ID01-9D]MDX5576811.1 hypothetical protein [Streptomyces sp. ID01-9D]WTC91743.1 hypothetical protein OH733_35575 [Streptomyces griseus]WTD65624.1 hypothetical protein OH763_01415 [Streptomyces griseus]
MPGVVDPVKIRRTRPKSARAGAAGRSRAAPAPRTAARRTAPELREAA